MLQIHPNARTTPAVRVEIARSSERPDVLAQRYGVSTACCRVCASARDQLVEQPWTIMSIGTREWA